MQIERPLCDQCGKRHFGQCLVGVERCFRCGGVGHYRMNCLIEKIFKVQGFQGQSYQQL